MQLDFKKLPKYCISLSRSSDRRVNVLREFMRVGLRVEFFDAVDRDDLILPELSPKRENQYNALGALACMRSHVKLMRKALKEGHEAIVVFEDDVVLCNDFNDRIGYIERTALKFDMLLLGGHFAAHKQGTLIGAAEGTDYNHIFHVLNSGGTYGYIITKKVMEFCVRNLHYEWGVDQFFSDVLYKRFNCLAFVPFLVGCSPGYSIISGSFWKYDAIDYYYQQEEVDLSKEYLNPTETEELRAKKVNDRNRAEWLKNNP